MASAFPSRSFFCLGLKSHLGWSLRSFQGVTQFSLTSPLYAKGIHVNWTSVFLLVKCVQSWRRRARPRTWKGRRKFIFLLYTCKGITLNSRKEWNINPWKTGINLRCIWLSERIQLNRLHPVWPHCDILGKVKLHRWLADHGVGIGSDRLGWIPVNMRLSKRIILYSAQGQSESIQVFFCIV